VRLPAGRSLVVAACLLCLPLVTPRIRGADEIEYFAYLRSAVFDGDLDFGNEYQHFYARDPEGLAGFKATFLDLREPRTGRHINFAPIGTALLWSPLYLAAHAGVRLLGGAADGYSWPYAAAACYGSWLYASLGLLLTHDALRRFGGLPEPAASWAVAALVWGTPLLYYVTLAPAFSHAASVLTVSLLLWLTLWARRPGGGVWDWMAVGAAAGLCALVREQDGLFVIVPLIVLVHDTLRTGEAWRGMRAAALLAATAAAVFVPQLLSYRALNGGFGPSKLVTRKMTWSSPHFLEVLLDPGHGLFVWAPLLLVSTAGLVLALRRRPDVVPAALLAGLLLQAWINGAVESWSQAGAFGSRRFVGTTAVFAWGLAAVLAGVTPSRRWLAGVALGLCAWWNVSLMVQFGLRLMDRQGMAWPRVAINQVTEVPPRVFRVARLFFSDRERLVEEAR
jgi:hypothetical protein